MQRVSQAIALAIILSSPTASLRALAQDDWDGWQSDFAEPYDETLWLRGVESVGFIVKDDVTGECWTNLNALGAAMELSLRRAGVEIALGYSGSHVLALSATGGPMVGGGCFGQYDLRFGEALAAGTLVSGASDYVLFYPLISGGVMVGPTMNETLRNWASERTDALSLRILRAQSGG